MLPFSAKNLHSYASQNINIYISANKIQLLETCSPYTMRPLFHKFLIHHRDHGY